MSCSEHREARAFLVEVRAASPESTDEEVDAIMNAIGNVIDSLGEEIHRLLAESDDPHAQRLRYLVWRERQQGPE